MKYGIVAIVIASFAAIAYGFSIKDEAASKGDRFIGFGTLGLFLGAMPLFLIKESKGKRMKDYMLTKENIEKMNQKEGKQAENQ